MSPDQTQDAVWVARAREGDPRAFDALMDQHYPSAYRLALHYTRDPDEAEDIAQEAFFQAYVHLDTLNDGMCFATWVLSIASNLAKNWIRQCRRSRIQRDDGGRIDISLMDLRTPESRYGQNEERWFVGDALFGLPKEDRDLLIRFYLRGISCREIGQCLGISEQVVQGRLQTARDRLKGKIAGKGVCAARRAFVSYSTSHRTKEQEPPQDGC